MTQCGAPWCSHKLKKGEIRTIGGVKVCRACYADAQYEAIRLGVHLHSLSVHTMKPPRRYPRRTQALPCPRCHASLPKKIDDRRLKRIGLIHVCCGCYQAAWRLTKEKNITMEEAWKLLPPWRGYRNAVNQRRGL